MDRQGIKLAFPVGFQYFKLLMFNQKIERTGSIMLSINGPDIATCL